MDRYDIRVYEWEAVKAEDGDFVLYTDAQATVEALTKERDKAVTRCAHLDILLRDEYLPKLDVEAVKRSIADRDHRIDELEREIEQLDDTVEALQGQVKELEGNRVPHSMQHVIEWQAMNNRLGAQVEALQRELEHAKKMEAVQKEVADNQTWHVRELRAALDAERGEVAFVEQTVADFQALWRTACDQREVFETHLSTLQGLVETIKCELFDRYDGAPDSPTRWMGSLIRDIEIAQALPATPTGEAT